MEDYFKDIEEWGNSFYCNECSNEHEDNFSYQRSVANGEVWICNGCKAGIMTAHKPNEDNY